MKTQSNVMALLRGLMLAAVVAGPAIADPANNLPPLGAGQARVIVYRPLEPYQSLRPTRFLVDGQLLVRVENGTFVYRDLPAGPHIFAVRAEVPYPGQTQTVTLAPHAVIYLTIASGENPGNTYGEGSIHVLRIVDASLAQAEVTSLRQLDPINVREAAQVGGK
jgi:hypothetical protein